MKELKKEKKDVDSKYVSVKPCALSGFLLNFDVKEPIYPLPNDNMTEEEYKSYQRENVHAGCEHEWENLSEHVTNLPDRPADRTVKFVLLGCKSCGATDKRMLG